MELLFGIIRFVCWGLTWAIVARIILSWFSPGQSNMLAVLLYRITEPILQPLRRIIPRAGMFDFTPLAAIVVLRLIIRFLS